METETQFGEVGIGDIVLTSGDEYIPVDAGEPLKAHIRNVKTVQAKKFDSEELETKLVIGFELDEGEGKGQVYTGWYRPSLNPKSNLAKAIVAIYGELPAKLDVTDLIGRPLRITLTEGQDKKGDGRKRQYVDTFLKPVKGQERVEVLDAQGVADFFNQE